MFRVLSLGAGVQSTTTLLMSLEGVSPRLDAAIFADTGWEPRAVYDHLALLRSYSEDRGLPVLTVGTADLREATMAGDEWGGVPIPAFSGRSGAGLMNRQCTYRWKVRPVRAKLRELMREAKVKRAAMVYGISADEVGRMRDPDVKYLDNEYPLVDAGMRRADCQRFLSERGWDAPRSACIGCPYNTKARWRAVKNGPADEWANAIEVDRAIRSRPEPLYLHNSKVPLEEADMTIPEDHGQLNFGDFSEECHGVCGV